MKVAYAVLGDVAPVSWSADWAWGLPLIVIMLVIHVFGLLLINEKSDQVQTRVFAGHNSRMVFAAIIGGSALFATLLHGAEVMIWAAAYRLLGALPDTSSAILYSLSAMTAYGHARLDLERHWQLMGALESLNGMLLFGLTTAFLFGIVQRAWALKVSRSR
jgi:hypothetical protein